MNKPSLHIEADAPFAEKVRVLQDFLGNHYFDENGLMYSMWFWKGDELRPFRMEDFDGYSYASAAEGWTPRGWNNNENSAWSSGHFLWSQCLRFQATRDELLSLYTIQVDLERDIWRPCRVPPTPERAAHPPYYNWHFCFYYSEVCWGDQVGRIPHVSLMAHQYAQDFCPGALTLAKTILRKLDDQRLHWFIDPDGRQLLPPDAWMAHVLSSEVPAFTLLAYWTARANCIPLE